VTLQTRVTLLSEVYATAGYAHGRTAVAILQALMGRSSPEIIPDLGALHRACVWENIVLKKHLASKGLDPSGGASDPPLPLSVGLEPDMPSLPGEMAMSNGTVNGAETSATGLSPSAQSSAAVASDQVKESAHGKNAHALRHIVTQMPAALSPLFQGPFPCFHHVRLLISVQLL
jgi:E3 ubiquitin-protein ligase HUWE1